MPRDEDVVAEDEDDVVLEDRDDVVLEDWDNVVAADRDRTVVDDLDDVVVALDLAGRGDVGAEGSRSSLALSTSSRCEAVGIDESREEEGRLETGPLHEVGQTFEQRDGRRYLPPPRSGTRSWDQTV